MPSYDVIAPGFYEGELYDPNGKRREIHTEKPIKPVPSWLQQRDSETPAQARARKAAETKARKAAADKAKADKIEKDAVNFTEAPSLSQSKVETL